ncbi:transposase family protein [Streptomyces sp. NPDC004787]|uniref:transposase family protein n=1 Tax=Streptomyces sp. NPDC004787 TaxID=3154291 RepID=UPI0033A388C3
MTWTANELVQGRRCDVEPRVVDHGGVVGTVTRAAIVSNRRIPGLPVGVFAELVADLGPLWHVCHEAKLVSRPWQRAVGAGAEYRLVFIDWLLATLVHLRYGVTRDVLACWFGVSSGTRKPVAGWVKQVWPHLEPSRRRPGPGSSSRTRRDSR